MKLIIKLLSGLVSRYLSNDNIFNSIGIVTSGGKSNNKQERKWLFTETTLLSSFNNICVNDSSRYSTISTISCLFNFIALQINVKKYI